MTAVSCVVCQADTDAYLCTRCTRELEQALGDLPALLAELDVTATRQDRGTGTALYAMRRTRLWHEALTAQADASDVPAAALRSRDGHKTLPTTPWPFSWDAANLAWTVRNTLGTWQRHLTESRGIEHGDQILGGVTGPTCRWCAHQSCAQIGVNPHRRRDVRVAAWLMRNLDAIRMDEAAGEIHDAITGDRLDIERAIDRQDPDAYYGRCDMPDVRVELSDGLVTPRVGICGAELLGRIGDDEVKCGACGAVYEVKSRRQYLVESVDDEWARPHAIANALTSLDEPVRPDTLRKWIERDAELAEQARLPRYPLILQVGVDDDGKPVYRVGDVRARIAAMKERREMMSA